MVAKTLYDKLFDSHVVTEENGTAMIYIDRHLVHEVTSPQAFEGLRLAGRKLWRISSIVATADHNTPTNGWDKGLSGIADPVSRLQIETLTENINEFGAKAYFPFMDSRQGIVHVVGPEQGATLPGMTVVCGDSHTSTHGAFGALAHGIGTSEVEHVMATQCLMQKKSKNMHVLVEGVLGKGVTAKDVALAIIAKTGTAGGTGYAIEFAGSVIRALSMEGRMTLCNMAIEAGARAGMVAVDDATIDFKNCLGIIASVSTLALSNGATKPFNWTKASISYSVTSEFYRQLFLNLYQSHAMYCNQLTLMQNQLLLILITYSFTTPA